MVDPPSSTGAVHENFTYVQVMLAEIAVKAVGGSGTVRNIIRENVKESSKAELLDVFAFTLQV